jgi:site-specific recombinase XerD
LNEDAVQKQFLPGTIKSYLSSLRHWYSYVLADEAERIRQEDKEHIQNMSQRVQRWINSYSKESSARHLQKMDSDLAKLITPDQVALFDRSEPVLTAIKCLGDIMASPDAVVTQTDYVLIRDFLLTQIIITNANRSGVLSNMTVDEFRAARKIDDSYVVSVRTHKTASVHGPATVVLSLTLFNWINVFLEHVRCQVATRVSDKTRFLFLSWNSEKMESGQITRAVQSVWRKAGLGTDITCTLMRKSAVSAIHQKNPNDKDKLADLMGHTTQTASKCYRLVQKQHSSVAASHILSDIMKSGDNDVNPTSQLPAAATHNERALENEADLESIHDLEPDATEITRSEHVDQNPTAADLDSDSSDIVNPSTKSSKGLFDKTDAETIRQCCQDIIKSGPISQRRLQDVMRCNENLLSKFTIHQLMNRVKYERRLMRAGIPKRFVNM